MNQTESTRTAQELIKKSAQDGICRQLDDAMYLLKSQIEDLESLKREVQEPDRTVKCLGLERAAEHLMAKATEAASSRMGSIVSKLSRRYRDVLKALAPVEK